jgi:hypothetical protein
LAIATLLALLPGSIPLQADGIIVIGDSWAEPIGNELRDVLAENGHAEIPVQTTPYWGGPRNLDTPEGFEAISGWLDQWPDANFIYMMMGQNNWLCCWTTDMIGSQEEADLFASIVDHTESVVDHIWSIRPDARILWTAGEYFRPHHLGTPTELNANHDSLAELAAEFATGRYPELTFLDWNGLLQVTYGFDGVQHSEFDPDHAIPPGDPSLPDPTLPSPFEAYPIQRPAHPTQAGYKVMARALWDQYFAAGIDGPDFQINAGLNDAWYNPATLGQGFFVTVFEDIGMMFLAWFTYDTERPPEDVQAMLGDPGHRWLTAFGDYADNQAVLEIEVTSGGVFDSTEPSVSQEADGTITVEFTGCNAATVTYDIPSIEEQGTVPIERIALDNVPLCESFNEVIQAR